MASANKWSRAPKNVGPIAPASLQLSPPACVHHRPVEIVWLKVSSQYSSSVFYVQRYSQVLCSLSNIRSGRPLRDIYRLHTFPALGHLVGYLLTFVQGLKSAACYPRAVHEEVFSTVLWRDEAKALLLAKPLHRSLGHALKPTFPSLDFSVVDKPILVSRGSAPAASKPRPQLLPQI